MDRSFPRGLPLRLLLLLTAVLAGSGPACSARARVLTEAPAREDFDEGAYEDYDEDEVEFYRMVHGMLAEIGMPFDTPLALSTRRSGPVDPVETGDAYLALNLIDRHTGKPFESDVILWRIGAPPNAYWTAGDQEVARAKVPVEGYRFDDLADGAYRPVVLRERALAPYPAPVRVAGPSRLELAVDPARERPVRLVLPRLAPTTLGLEVYLHPLEGRCGLREPPWLVRREVQPDFDGREVILFGPFDLGSSWSEEGRARLRRTPTGFDAGSHPEDTRWCTYTRELSLRPDGPGTPLVSVHIRNPPREPEPVESLVVRIDDE